MAARCRGDCGRDPRARPDGGILPKLTDGVMLASPIFDHSKIAMIDEMIRSGVPAQNPFFSEVGRLRIASPIITSGISAPPWSACLTGVSGWEADAALTWFTAFASLLVMIAIAIRIGGRPSAAGCHRALLARASLRSACNGCGRMARPARIGWTTGFGGWLFQTSWAPQHIASAMCVALLAGSCCHALATRRATGPQPSPPALWPRRRSRARSGSAASCSRCAALAIGLYCTLGARAAHDVRLFVVRALAAGCIALVLVAALAYDQLIGGCARAQRHRRSRIRPVTVLGDAVPEPFRRLLDVPAYWLVYLPVEFPAFYLAGMASVFGDCSTPRRAIRSPDHWLRAPAGDQSSSSPGFCASIIGDNNDLGWRAVLPAVMLLIPARGCAISRWPVSRARGAAVAAAGDFCSACRMTARSVRDNLSACTSRAGQIFAATPAMWEAVRRHTPPDERVANNPLFLADMTPWPVNISWALLADRRSCYAGRELADAVRADLRRAPRPRSTRSSPHIFAGEADADDIEQLAKRFAATRRRDPAGRRLAARSVCGGRILSSGRNSPTRGAFTGKPHRTHALSTSDAA